MELQDIFALLHPAIAITVVFPLIGIVVNRALLTRQRRLQTKEGQKSKIPPRSRFGTRGDRQFVEWFRDSSCSFGNGLSYFF